MTDEISIHKKNKVKRIVKWTLISIGLIVFVLIYKFFNPYKDDFFPSCPFYAITGLKCPGCGSQRAIHNLLNLDFVKAFKENMLMVISIPYIILGAYFDLIKLKTERQLKVRKLLYGQKAILIVLIIVIGFWILRNVSI